MLVKDNTENIKELAEKIFEDSIKPNLDAVDARKLLEELDFIINNSTVRPDLTFA